MQWLVPELEFRADLSHRSGLLRRIFCIPSHCATHPCILVDVRIKLAQVCTQARNGKHLELEPSPFGRHSGAAEEPSSLCRASVRLTKVMKTGSCSMWERSSRFHCILKSACVRADRRPHSHHFITSSLPHRRQLSRHLFFIRTATFTSSLSPLRLITPHREQRRLPAWPWTNEIVRPSHSRLDIRS